MSTGRRLLSAASGALIAIAGSGLIFGVTATPAGAAPLWTAEVAGAPGNINAVSFADTNNGVLGGDVGFIAQTTNGGATWTPATTPATLSLRGISMVDSTHAWAVGQGGFVWTLSSPNTWTAQTSGVSDLISVSFANTLDGCAVGGSGGMTTCTQDGGAVWNPVASFTPQDLNGVDMVNASDGWAVGNAGVIFNTIDGGATWHAQSSGTTEDLFAVSFTDASHGHAVGNSGTILSTLDGGITWTPQVSGTSNALRGVSFNADGTGWADGIGGTILATSNNGNTWAPQTSINGSFLEGISTVDSTHAWAVGSTNTAEGFSNPNTNAVTHFSVVPIATTVTAGATTSFTVTALDQFNNVVPGYTGTVHFTSTDTAAVLPADSILTNGTGTFNDVLKTATDPPEASGPASQTITATDISNSSINGTTVGITVDPAAATHFAFTNMPAVPVPANSPFGFTVSAVDQFGNVVTTYAGTVHFTSTDHGVGVSLPADQTLTLGTANLAANFVTAGTQTLTATDTLVSSITGTSPNVTVVAGSPTKLVVVNTPVNATAGTPFAFTVKAEDAVGNVVTSFPNTDSITFSTTSALKVLPGASNLVNGVGTFSATLNTTGSQTISATDVTNVAVAVGTSAGINVLAGPATAYTFVGVPGSVSAGSPISPFTVQAVDAFGNNATGYNGTANFTSSDAQAVLPGPATFTGGVTGPLSATLKTAGSQTITATDNANPSITRNVIVLVSPAAATHFVFTTPASAVAGANFTYSIAAEDQFGNVDTSFADSVNLFSLTDTYGGTPSVTFAAGLSGPLTGSFQSAGSQTITAHDTTAVFPNGVSNAILITSGAATHFKVTAPASATAGTPFSFTVTAQDAFDNTATGYSGIVNFTSTDAAAVLPANSSLSFGVGTFSATLKTATTPPLPVLVPPAPAPETITATDTVTATITGVSAGTQVSPAAATHYVVVPDPTLIPPLTVPAGTPMSFSVQAEDQFGNLAIGYAGTAKITSSDAQAVLPGNLTFAAGQAGGSITFKTTGTQSVVATDTIVSSITGSANVTVAPAATIHLVVSAPSSVTAGSPFSFTVTAEDQFNNVDTTYAGTVHFSLLPITDTGSLPADYTFVPGDAGVHTFTGASLNDEGSQSLNATDAATPASGSTTINVLAGPVTQLVITQPIAQQTAGLPFTVTVTAEDMLGNTVTGFTDAVAITSSDMAAVLPLPTQLTNGVGTFTVTLKTAGSDTVTATDVADPTLTDTAPVTVVAATATQLTVTTPGSVQAGTSFTAHVAAFDQFGNPALTDTDVVQITSTDGQGVMPANAALIAGQRNFTVTLKTAGPQSVTATDTTSPTVKGTAHLTVTPAPAVGFSIVAPANAVAGTPISFTVTALDQFNNVVTGYSGTVHFTSTDAVAVLPANSTLILGVGTFSATMKTAGNQTIKGTDTVTSSINGTSNTINVAPAPATHFIVSAPSITQAGVSFTFTVTALDQFNNVDTNYNQFVHILSSDAKAILPNNVHLSNGTLTSSATFITVGSQTLSATDVVLPNITGQTTITVIPGPATHFSVVGPGQAQVGQPFNVTVTALDQFGNVANAYAGTVHFTSTDSAAQLPANTTLTNGIKVFSVTLNTSGPQSVTVTDTINPSITGTTGIFLVLPPPVAGYDLAGADGGVFALGAEPYEGSLGGKILNAPIVGIALTPDGNGYWLVGGDGGIFTFGDAGYYGSTGALHLNKPIVGIARTPSGKGYWMVASDGGIFAFGDAQFWGSTGSLHLNKPIVGMATTPSGKGYWLVASDGGIFAFGDANFWGSLGDVTLNQPIVGIAAESNGLGYWMVAKDGGVFTFGTAPFLGSIPASNFPVSQPAPAEGNDVIGIAPTTDNRGYWIVERDATVHPFGDATPFGPPLNNAGFAPDDIVGIATGPSLATALH